MKATGLWLRVTARGQGLWHVIFQTELGGVGGALVSLGVAVLSFHLWESLWTRRSGVERPATVVYEVA